MASPALPGLLLCFAAMVLLIFATVSVPIWDKISFLDATTGGKNISFGVFGYTGSAKMLGYYFNQQTLGFNDSKLASTIYHNLTYVLILHPVAAGLCAIACIFGLCGAGYSRAATVLMALTAGLANLVTMVAWVIDMVLFGIVKSEINNNGGSASYGNANWITLGAFVALSLAFCAGICGALGHYRERRRDSYAPRL